MRTWTGWVLRHRGLVGLGWVMLTVAGALGVTPAIDAMTDDFGALPGRPGYETNQEILVRYGDGGAADPLVLVVTLPRGTTVDSPGVRGELAAAFTRAARLVGATRVLSYPSTGDRSLVSTDGRTTFALIYPPAQPSFPPYARAVAVLTAALPGIWVAGSPLELTGTDALFMAAADATGPGLMAEIVVAGVAALVVLALVFGSALALLPLLTAVIAILVTFLAVGPDRDRRRVVRRPVPGRTDRPRRRDRLRAAHHDPMA
jgi:RND superfamily putative drug exporter